MTCQYTDNLAPFLDGELSDEENARIEAHLGTCADCAEFVAILKRSYNALEHLESLDVPAGLAAAARKKARKTWRVPAFAAAAALLVIALVSARFATNPVAPGNGVNTSLILAGLSAEEQAVVSNMDILEDYEILEDVEDLELLAQLDTLVDLEDFPEIENFEGGQS
jgi:anti-sigma factor RsiW